VSCLIKPFQVQVLARHRVSIASGDYSASRLAALAKKRKMAAWDDGFRGKALFAANF
jgi:hypothetical protein